MIGYDSFTEHGLLWRVHHGAVVPLSMPHVTGGLELEQAKSILRSRHPYFIRWDSEFDKAECRDWWHIIKSEHSEISDLKKKTRNMVRRGLSCFDIRRCDSDFIANHGYEVYRMASDDYDTFERTLSKQEFSDAVLSLPNETEFWVAIDSENGDVQGFAENFIHDEACFYLTMWFKPEALKRFLGYALIHSMNVHYLLERKMNYVSDGARSISHQTGIHDFLESKFGFRKAYSKLNVVYAPHVSIMVKALFPFRQIFSKCSGSLSKKISILLEQERIRRKCAVQSGDGNG